MVSEVTIPVMDQTTETVVLTGWLLQEGEAVRAGQVVCEIETDKATVEITAPADGVLRKILVAAGTQVPPRTVVALVGAADEPLPEVDPFYRTARAEAAPAPLAAPTTPMRVERPPAQKIIVSPRARRLAEAHNLDLSTVQGTGPGGRIQEEDVQQALAATAEPAAGGRAAQAKAERVSAAWQTIPHFFTAMTVDLTRVAAAKAAGPSGVTYTDYFALALGRTLPDHPDLNGYWKADALERAAEVRLGLVVEAEHGLVIPALADLRGRTLDDIAAERERVVTQARAGKLSGAAAGTPTFSLTNVGPGHIDAFTAIISPPQVAMLTAGSVQRRPMVVGEAVVARLTVTFTLCADHRAVDGRQAARFLEQLKQTLEHEHSGV